MSITDTARSYIDALEQQDVEAITALLTEDATIDIPLSNTGSLDPWFVFVGHQAALRYVETIFKNFETVRLVERNVFAPDDGQTVFAELTGDLIQRGRGASYRNRYVFKFTIRDRQVSHLTEYANPVTFARLMGLPLG
ncbi:nuclear transport factor 2 family protein [Brevundimonas sp.]|uniref:nuclear transport factor 2 family protein n=1 Tax=Brevundimonas sp. TaxID=1871086 RepID=UPI002ABC59F3|nr:nuclear transport factor 2 family protein [Brevundimonas sp.]MDZ4361788.1 nuclear transport factor 2 family protein [Brevundimonas sp.]